MLEEIAFGGSGGQGVLFIGRLLAEAALLENREVEWMPSYSAEKRGGSVYCSVIISDDKIGSMFVTSPNAAVAMDLAWRDRFKPIIRSGGLLIANQSSNHPQMECNDIQIFYLPANELAALMGDSNTANLVALGGLIMLYPVVSDSSIMKVLDKMLAKDKKRLKLDKLALKKGILLANSCC